MNGNCATFSNCFSASGSIMTPRVQARVGTPPSVLMTLCVSDIVFSSEPAATNIWETYRACGAVRIRTGDPVVPQAFAAGLRCRRQDVARVRDSNPLNHVLPPAFASSLQEPTRETAETGHC